MPLFNVLQIRDHIPPNHRLLGIDPGQRQIGLALSDVALMLASPLTTIKRGKLSAFAAEITRLRQREDIGAFVMGLPLSLDGSFGPAAQAAQDQAKTLSEMTGLPGCMWDERLSSSAVNRMLIQDVDMTRKRRAEVVDKVAAAYILQAALDAIAGA